MMVYFSSCLKNVQSSLQKKLNLPVIPNFFFCKEQFFFYYYYFLKDIF